ncbi:hypothetical protein LIER_33337 [Lithospermum erythrorhizon]|uniref:Non-structural maintenance of chromosomes element 4 n=1 Tax=Lithospermum erythrorhizon TaxID=34254 RepID=A0AAV3S047_LITER
MGCVSVNKPREQLADAEALLELTESLHACVKSHAVSGISTSEFMYCLLKDFKLAGRETRKHRSAECSIDWEELGLSVSPIFKNGKGCNTMLGPMSNVLQQRKAYACRRRTRISKRENPKELDDGAEKTTDTDKNIVVMFEILKKKKTVQLENLVLNRKSFAQTVENLFSLSFLVKDGRVRIDVDDQGSHLVSPTNAPDSKSILSGEDRYDHFVFRFDFSDWKLMMNMVPEGKELMPHRELLLESCYSQATTDNASMKNMSRNHGVSKCEKLNLTDSFG